VEHDATWWRGHIRRIEACDKDCPERTAWFHQAWLLHPKLLQDHAMVHLARQLGWLQSEAFRSHFSLRFPDAQIILIGPNSLGDLVECNTLNTAVGILSLSKSTDSFIQTSVSGTIALLPGTYKHGLHTSSSQIDIIALGTVRIEDAEHHPFAFHGNSDVRLHGLHILQTFHTVDIDRNLRHALIGYASALVTLENCEISNSCGLAIGLSDSAQLFASNVLVVDSYGGLVAEDTAQITCNHLSVREIRYTGLELRGTAAAIIKQSKFRRIGRSGIFCHNGSPHLTVEGTHLSQTGSHSCSNMRSKRL